MEIPVVSVEQALSLCKIARQRECILRRLRVTPLGFCLRVIVNEILINLEKTTSSVLSVFLINGFRNKTLQHVKIIFFLLCYFFTDELNSIVYDYINTMQGVIFPAFREFDKPNQETKVRRNFRKFCS